MLSIFGQSQSGVKAFWWVLTFLTIRLLIASWLMRQMLLNRGSGAELMRVDHQGIAVVAGRVSGGGVGLITSVKSGSGGTR